MNQNTKKIILIVVALLAVAGGVYFAFFNDRAPKVDPAIQQQQDALVQSYKDAEAEANAKSPNKTLEIFEEPKPAANPGGGLHKAPDPK